MRGYDGEVSAVEVPTSGVGRGVADQAPFEVDGRVIGLDGRLKVKLRLPLSSSPPSRPLVFIGSSKGASSIAGSRAELGEMAESMHVRSE